MTEHLHSCPWSGFEQRTVSFCEAPLCGYIVEPANSWSNIGYLIVAFLILRREKKLNFFAITSAYLFFGSTAFHSTGTFFGEVLDLSAMFLISGTLLTLNAQRVFGFDTKKSQLFFWSLFLVSIALLMVFKPLGIAIFSVQSALYVLSEIKLSKHKPENFSYSLFKTGIAIFAAAFTFWVLDITKILCDPHNHIFTGHSAWHLLTAGAIYYFYRFYSYVNQVWPAKKIDLK